MTLARVVHQALWRAARAPVRRPNLDAIRAALARAEALVQRIPTPTPPAPRPLAPVIPIRSRAVVPPPPEPEVAPSAWDPEPSSGTELIAARAPEPRSAPEPRDEELLLQEINGCKTLLLEIIRRTAYDWVLYRGSRRMVQKTCADLAYRWLFEEVEGTPDWAERMREKKYITSFVAICEGLDLDPDTVRRHIRRLTPKNVMSVGRPAEYRRRDVVAAGSDEDVYSLPEGLIEYSDGGDDGSTL